MPSDIYKLHDAAFSRVSAYVILEGGDRVATIAFKQPADGAGRLWVYVHFFGIEMVRGCAGGFGYDKQTAACAAASRAVRRAAGAALATAEAGGGDDSYMARVRAAHGKALTFATALRGEGAGGGVIFLFPCRPWNADPDMLEAFSPVDGHTGVSADWVRERTCAMPEGDQIAALAILQRCWGRLPGDTPRLRLVHNTPRNARAQRVRNIERKPA